MTDRRRHLPPGPRPTAQRHPRLALRAALIAPLFALVAACTSAGSATSGPSSAASTGTPAPSVAASAASGAATPATTAGPSLPSQTDTTWGRIWDALPPSFPLPSGANPTETGEGPATARFEVPGSVDATATFFQGALERAGYSTLSLSGPMEDGSRQLESQGAAGCRIRTTVAPHGATTLVTVLFGASCPFA